MSAIVEEFFRVSPYKRSQGRIVRQATLGAIAISILAGLSQMVFWLRAMESVPPAVCYGVPAILGIVGLWAAYRSVNLPVFADFLIAVETEMNKVSWPSWAELVRWTAVVILLIFVIGFLLYGFDAFWVWLFRLIGIYAA